MKIQSRNIKSKHQSKRNLGIMVLLTMIILPSILNYSFVPMSGPSTNYGLLEIIPQNDSLVPSTETVSYYNLQCDRYKVNIASSGSSPSVTKGVINETLNYPNLRRTYTIGSPGSDARYDFMCWVTTYTASGKNYTSSKQLLKVGSIPSQTPTLTISYATTNFQVNYNLPNTNGSGLTYLDVYMRSKGGKFYRLCHFTPTVSAPIILNNSCVVSGFTLIDHPYNMDETDLISVYTVSGNSFGVSSFTYSNQIYCKTPPKNPLTSPTQNALTNANQIVIDIASISNALSYTVEYSTVSALSGFVTLSSGTLATTYILSQLSFTIGQQYYFKYMAVNEFGESKFSPVKMIVIASAPSRMLPPNLTYSSENPGTVSFKVFTSSPNGSTILGYNLKVMSAFGDLLDIAWCDSSQTECFFPVYTFTDSPFYLTAGDFIQAESSNYNAIGSSEYSSMSSGLLLKSAPKMPSTSPYNTPYTNSFQIALKINAFTQQEASYDTISSYNVVLILGGYNFINIVGADSQEAFTDTSQTIYYYDVIAGNTYQFAYRAKNSFGWGPFSEIGYITVPTS